MAFGIGGIYVIIKGDNVCPKTDFNLFTHYDDISLWLQ